MQCSSPLDKAGFNILPASIAPSDFPAPTMVCNSSIKTIGCPKDPFSEYFVNPLSTDFNLSSNSPLYLAPAKSAAKSSDRTLFPLSPSGTSSFCILCARPSTIAVFPTPGSPIKTGLFFVLR